MKLMKFWPRKKEKEFSLPFVAFWQATGLMVYCSLVGVVFWKGDEWLGPPFAFWGPALLLVLFVGSALISALIVLGYPFILFWEKKQTVKALKLVGFTIAWLAFYFIASIFLLASV